MESHAGLSLWELWARVLAAAALGGLIGFEREYHDQPAGFRTHILVSLGAALFTLLGTYGMQIFTERAEVDVRLDPSRVTAQIVSGIGFLGAGAILRFGLNVRGLTTAAALWATAAIGAAAGLGYYEGAISTAVVVLVALYGLKRAEEGIIRRIKAGQYRFTIEMDGKLRLHELATALESHRARVDRMNVMTDDQGNRRLVATLVLPSSITPAMLSQQIGDVSGVTRVEFE